jgi:hypothetical protein
MYLHRMEAYLDNFPWKTKKSTTMQFRDILWLVIYFTHLQAMDGEAQRFMFLPIF